MTCTEVVLYSADRPAVASLTLSSKAVVRTAPPALLPLLVELQRFAF